MGRKRDSLLQLEKLGFNIPECMTIMGIPGKGGIVFPLEWGEKISVRMDVKDSRAKNVILMPFKANMDQKEALDFIKNNLRPDMIAIIAKGIDPDDCVAKGRFMRTENCHNILECTLGPGTVRDMEKITIRDPNYFRVEERIYIPHFPEEVKLTEEYKITLRKMMKDCITKIGLGIVEWSLYPYPVGILNHHLICWEIIPLS